MAGQPWNSVNIPFPGAVSCVRIHSSPKTIETIRVLLVRNETVVKLIRSEFLQTEVRVLYELQYILNHTFRANKTFKALKQVEQCVNRLKMMKLDAALGDLTLLCPTGTQREVSIKTGECDVPSQPMLEWLCLKVLGAAQLMSCSLDRCSRAFIRSRQQLKLEEFIILNLVITSLLGRLWVIFRGILFSLSSLYQQLLVFLSEVAQSRSMPYLTDFSLPADFSEFLGPSFESLLKKQLKAVSSDKTHTETEQQRKAAKAKTQLTTRKVKEDLGVSVERDIVHNKDLKPFLEIFKKIPEAEKRERFNNQVKETTSFSDMGARLEDVITWCKSQGMQKENVLLSFLRLKCRKMSNLETEGYKVQRKLQIFRRDVLGILSPPAHRTSRASSSVLRRNPRLRKRFKSLRDQFRRSAVRTSLKKKRSKRENKNTKLSATEDVRSCSTAKVKKETSQHENHDDIDDIFASKGW
ncbi:nucleolus and neural progenitor protein isoform X2 [Cynoglossus semilaevis]|uniref:nucleolus and neural progenitor protein isoform X2 n=1 Tax=Cynoglossus semilaevis TaxID=244447 RepID=UPI000D6232DC|nr:nucleolus and neural progenitor protein isoform X2 [Cynoglossus semilaevis]